jgi:hypothetical protein
MAIEFDENTVQSMTIPIEEQPEEPMGYENEIRELRPQITNVPTMRA